MTLCLLSITKEFEPQSRWVGGQHETKFEGGKLLTLQYNDMATFIRLWQLLAQKCLKFGHPRRPLFVYFQSFELTLRILQQINVKSQSCIRCWDSISGPLEHQSWTSTDMQMNSPSFLYVSGWCLFSYKFQPFHSLLW